MCFWHAGNLNPEPGLRKVMRELAVDDRITVVNLGNAVQKTMQFKMDDYAEKQEDADWEKVNLELFVPVRLSFLCALCLVCVIRIGYCR